MVRGFGKRRHQCLRARSQGRVVGWLHLHHCHHRHHRRCLTQSLVKGSRSRRLPHHRNHLRRSRWPQVSRWLQVNLPQVCRWPQVSCWLQVSQNRQGRHNLLAPAFGGCTRKRYLGLRRRHHWAASLGRQLATSFRRRRRRCRRERCRRCRRDRRRRRSRRQARGFVLLSCPCRELAENCHGLMTSHSECGRQCVIVILIWAGSVIDSCL
jgi:hypothetical protein